jgi:hypothetical protein
MTGVAQADQVLERVVRAILINMVDVNRLITVLRAAEFACAPGVVPSIPPGLSKSSEQATHLLPEALRFAMRGAAQLGDILRVSVCRSKAMLLAVSIRQRTTRPFTLDAHPRSHPASAL